MACKKPIIIGIKGEAADLVNNLKSGTTIEPENANLLSNAIIDYYQNKDKCIRHGENGMVYVKKNLKKEKLILTVMNLIQKVEN